MKRVQRKSGFTLIEMIISIALLGIILVSFASLFIAGVKFLSRSGQKTILSFDHQAVVEQDLLNQGPGSNLSLEFFQGGTSAFIVDGIKTSQGEFNNFIPDLVGTLIPVTGVTLAPSNLAVNVGSYGVLTATVSPDDASNQTLIWTTSNAAVASVAGGAVHGISIGHATITVRTEDGSFTATATVDVSEAVVDSLLLNLYLSSGVAFDQGAFDPARLDYTQTSNTSVPTVMYTKANPGQTVVVNPVATNRNNKKVSKITVTGPSGAVTVYTVTFLK